MALLLLNYCTRCDKDISSSTGSVCPQCQSTTHSIAIDINEKCDNCGNVWIAHGNMNSGSACRNMAGFFTPNAASPTMPQGYTSQSVILAFNQAKQRFMSGQSYPSGAAHASPSVPQGYTPKSSVFKISPSKVSGIPTTNVIQPTPGLAARVDAIMTSAMDAAHRMANNKSSGAKCSKCGDFNEYAQAKPDGSFTCFGCRR
jgi:hypothetical protein